MRLYYIVVAAVLLFLIPSAYAAEYDHPEALVSTQWVADHMDDEEVRIVYMPTNDEQCSERIPNSVCWNWNYDLVDTEHPYLYMAPPEAQFEELMNDAGITNDMTVVLYDNLMGLWATRGWWVMEYWGHSPDKLKIMNGGIKKWKAEGREVTSQEPGFASTDYSASGPKESIIATKYRVWEAAGMYGASPDEDTVIVDSRSPAEYEGEDIRAMIGGHIATARNVNWVTTMNTDDHTFKSAEELKSIYSGIGVTRGKEAITYCQGAIRSAHSWFVLKYLVGINDVRNYDGSWTEWGNILDLPTEDKSFLWTSQINSLNSSVKEAMAETSYVTI